MVNSSSCAVFSSHLLMLALLVFVIHNSDLITFMVPMQSNSKYTLICVQFIISVCLCVNLVPLLVSLQGPPNHCDYEFLPWSIWPSRAHHYPGAEGTLGEKTQPDS